MRLLKIFLLVILMKEGAAQLPRCYVYTIIGDASVLRNHKLNSLKQGDFIFDADTIVLKKSASLNLLDYDNKFIMITSPGKYTYPDVQKSLDKKPTGITEKYFHFVWEHLLWPSSENRPVPSTLIGGAVGGAKRGDCPSTLIDPSDGAKVGNDTIRFRWRHVAGAAVYQLVLEDSVGGEFMNVIVKDTSISLLKRNLLKGEITLYHWKLLAGKRLREDCSNDFTVVSQSEEDKEIQILTNKVAKTNDEFLYYLQLSEVMAQNGWYDQAADYLKKAKGTLKR
jgi:hypothetical protein